MIRLLDVAYFSASFSRRSSVNFVYLDVALQKRSLQGYWCNTIYTRCIHAIVWRKQFIFFSFKIYLVTIYKWWKNLHVCGLEESQEDEIAKIIWFISRDICNDYVIKLTPWSMSWEANSFSASQEIPHLLVSSILIFRLKFVCIYNDYNVKHNVCYGTT
jgi:hypothetical protein